jgi:hypothetical protein
LWVNRIVFGRRPTISGLPLETDIVRVGRRVSNVPLAEVEMPGVPCLSALPFCSI